MSDWVNVEAVWKMDLLDQKRRQLLEHTHTIDPVWQCLGSRTGDTSITKGESLKRRQPSSTDFDFARTLAFLVSNQVKGWGPEKKKPQPLKNHQGNILREMFHFDV